MQLRYQIFSSAMGEILVGGNSFAVTHIMHGDNRTILSARFLLEQGHVGMMEDTSTIERACVAIANYLNGKSTDIDIAIAPKGTVFQRSVWQAIQKIPYGHTASYTDIARSIGAPHAFRAVAHACAENPIPLIIPCHRVIHKNGDVSGFAWGIEAKRYLLNLEKERVPELLSA